MEEAQVSTVVMPPKAKALGKAKAGAKAKAKGGVAPKVKAKARGKAVARVRGHGALRRPGRGRNGGSPPQDTKALWYGGHTVRGCDLCLDWLKDSKEVIVEESKYFHRDGKLAGTVVGTTLSEGQVLLKVRPTGTTDEGLLKYQSGNPQLELRLLLCKGDCNHEETADDLVHCLRLRKSRGAAAEEAWVGNLEKVAPEPPGDELEALRQRMDGNHLREAARAAEEKDIEKKKKKKEKEKDKSAKRSRSKKKKKRKRVSSPSSSATGEIALDGSRAKLASHKTPRKLFAGTGLDPSERVRGKVMRLAQKYVKKKGRKASNGSGSSSATSSGAGLEVEEDTLFQQAARVRCLAESYPGVLANQAVKQMRTHLLQGWGEEETSRGLPTVALQYYRQVLHRRAAGATGRELLTLCAVADCLAKGKAAQAMDVVLQRVKSVEATLNGTHWSVSQKLEVLPQEQSLLTDTAEMKEAQKIAQEESKTRWMAAQPDGRSQQGPKGVGKGKTGGRGDGRKGGKGGNTKGDGKRKEEPGAKSS